MQMMPAGAKRAAPHGPCRLSPQCADSATRPTISSSAWPNLSDNLADWGGSLHSGDCRLQCGAGQCAQMDGRLRRSAQRRRRSHRLDRADSLQRDTQLCAARDREYVGLSQPALRAATSPADSGRSLPARHGQDCDFALCAARFDSADAGAQALFRRIGGGNGKPHAAARSQARAGARRVARDQAQASMNISCFGAALARGHLSMTGNTSS